MEESFQSNKPCMNQDYPEFREFFEINDLKAQLQAKTTLIYNLKNQIKSVKEASNEAKVKNDIDVIETIKIELEHITPHYLPKIRESAPAKPHHVNAPSSSRNSKKESYSSNDMALIYFLEEGRKKTQERNRIPIPRDMASARTHRTPNTYTRNPMNISRCLHVSKSSCVPSNVVPLVDHSRNSSFFLDSKHFVCSTCQKCVFNANHDNCITKFLKEVNSRAKVQSHKTRNNNKPVEPKSHTQKPSRQIGIGQMFSLNKSSAVHEKPQTPRSCLGGNQRVEFPRLLVLGGYPLERCSSIAQPMLTRSPLVDLAHPFESPAAGETFMDFVNEHDYLEENITFTKDQSRLCNVTGDDNLLVNLKFVPKGKKDEVFGMPIPKELIREAIQQSPYYQQYQEMVARKPTAKEGRKKKTVSKAEQTK
ncbi:hypothetical protein Tco_0729088 [Tanacetum coccineum]|uniref:Uncharacterized protein n=1 Tax=Tanacetum coccineum TaxID=301880 RepID=A0ABQ4YQL1_9ASTR